MRDTIFIVLFRGVGGDTKLPTAPLREALSAAGFRKVITYIASGNVVLASDLPAEAVRARVATIARRELGFSKEIIVLTAREWAGVVRRNPFPQAASEPRTLHAFALAAKPAGNAVAALAARAAPPAALAVRGRALYLHTPEGFGKSKLPTLIERMLKVPMTARNWNTVLKLDRLAREAASQRGER